MTIERAELGAIGPIAQEPPSEFRLFAMGETNTKKGKFVLTAEGGKAIMDAFRESGLDALPFDAGHSSLAGALAHPDSHKSLGWFEPDMRDDGLHAANVQFTPATLSSLSNREYRFFSPAIDFDPKTREIRRLINVALTNLPATLGQKPLVLDETDPESPNMKTILARLGAEDETAGLSALTVLLTERDSLKTENATLAAKVETLLEQSVKDKREAFIEKLSVEGKLPPAQRPFAEKLSLEQLTAFAETLTAQVNRANIQTPSGSSDGQLSADDVYTMKMLGLTQEEFLTQRAKAAGKAE